MTEIAEAYFHFQPFEVSRIAFNATGSIFQRLLLRLLRSFLILIASSKFAFKAAHYLDGPQLPLSVPSSRGTL